jgi:hypothetical protein
MNFSKEPFFFDCPFFFFRLKIPYKTRNQIFLLKAKKYFVSFIKVFFQIIKAPLILY